VGTHTGLCTDSLGDDPELVFNMPETPAFNPGDDPHLNSCP
jgi:hypothetical protein